MSTTRKSAEQTVTRVIVFDLDDTLYLEKEYVMSGYNAVATYLSDSAGLDRHTLFETLEAGYHRGNRDRNFEALLARFGLSTPVEQLIAIYRRPPPHTNPPARCTKSIEPHRPAVRSRYDN